MSMQRVLNQDYNAVAAFTSAEFDVPTAAFSFFLITQSEQAGTLVLQVKDPYTDTWIPVSSDATAADTGTVVVYQLSGVRGRAVFTPDDAASGNSVQVFYGTNGIP